VRGRGIGVREERHWSEGEWHLSEGGEVFE
jgi:hypothetical protein